jgi:acyl carrier protein
VVREMVDGGRFERIKDVMVKTFGVDEERVTRTARLAEDLELDSLDWTELLVVLERQIGQEVTESEARGMRTVEDVLALLDRKLATSP